jgi:hypothetical protein
MWALGKRVLFEYFFGFFRRGAGDGDPLANIVEPRLRGLEPGYCRQGGCKVDCAPFLVMRRFFEFRDPWKEGVDKPPIATRSGKNGTRRDFSGVRRISKAFRYVEADKQCERREVDEHRI